MFEICLYQCLLMFWQGLGLLFITCVPGFFCKIFYNPLNVSFVLKKNAISILFLPPVQFLCNRCHSLLFFVFRNVFPHCIYQSSRNIVFTWSFVVEIGISRFTSIFFVTAQPTYSIGIHFKSSFLSVTSFRLSS